MLNKFLKFLKNLVIKPQEELVDVIAVPEIHNTVSSPTINDLNQITVKTRVINDSGVETEPVKKKRTYKKKKTKPAVKPKNTATKTTEKNGTTKGTNRKPPKKD